MSVIETKDGVVCPKCHCPQVPIVEERIGKTMIRRRRVCDNDQCHDRIGNPTQFWSMLPRSADTAACDDTS